MPFQGESAVKGTGPICGDFVVGLELNNKVVRVFFGKMFDAKIVNAQGERGGSFSVAPEAWIMWGRFISVWGEVANNLVKGNESCIFEDIHAASYLKLYETVGGNVDVVTWIIPYFLGDHIWEGADVLEVLHGCAKVEVFDVDAELVGTFVGIGDGAIYVEFIINHTHDRIAGISRVV